MESDDQSCDSSADATNGCSINWAAGSLTSIRLMKFSMRLR
jgi:hypothetical protein